MTITLCNMQNRQNMCSARAAASQCKLMPEGRTWLEFAANVNAKHGRSAADSRQQNLQNWAQSIAYEMHTKCIRNAYEMQKNYEMEKASKFNIFHHFDRSNCIQNSYEMQNNYEIVNHACKNYKSIVISKPCPGTGKFKYVCQYIPFNSMDKMRKLGYHDARSESRRNVTKCYEILTKYLRNTYEILTKYLRNTYEILTK